MEITHVIRGEEWLPSLALHILLYRAFDWEAPKFSHLPLILKPQGKGKLSKRDGDKLGFPVFPLAWKEPKTGEISSGYREENYLPEALINMLSLLGWNPGTEQEFFNLEELVSAFEISRVHKSGAKFDPEKTKWFQQHYLQLQPDVELAKNFNKILEVKGISSYLNYTTKVVNLLKERAVFVDDLWDLGSYFFVAPSEFDPKASKKAWKENSKEMVENLIEIISEVNPYNAENLQNEIKAWISKNEIGFGKVMQPFRLSLVGAMQGPDVFEIAGMLGKEETLNRLNYAIKTL
jgi:glutamyl-tRNA synthetase